MYVGDIQHIGKVVPILHSINGLLITELFMEKTWVKHLVFGIYRDRYEWMQGLSQSKYIEFNVERVQ